jgi:hypothetical protein
MSKTRIFGMGSVLALAFLCGGAAHAQTTAPAAQSAPAASKKTTKAAAQMTASGTIASIDATHLVITSKVNGADTPMNFVLNSTTKQDANLAAGSKVTVRYHKDNNDQVASTVRAQATTAKAKKTTTTGAKKS